MESAPRNAVRGALLLLHIGGLLLGTFFAVLAVQSVIDNFARDFPELALSRIAVAVALVVVVVAFAAILPLRGFTRAAPFLFALSYALVGVIVGGHTRGMAKNFAPTDPSELPRLYTLSSAEIIAVCAIAVAA